MIRKIALALVTAVIAMTFAPTAASAYVGYIDSNRDGVFRQVTKYPACVNEDGSGQPNQSECVWNGKANGTGPSYVFKGFDAERAPVRITHRQAHRWVKNHCTIQRVSYNLPC